MCGLGCIFPYCKFSEKRSARRSQHLDAHLVEIYSNGTGLNMAFERWHWHWTECDKGCLVCVCGGNLTGVKIQNVSHVLYLYPFFSLICIHWEKGQTIPAASGAGQENLGEMGIKDEAICSKWAAYRTSESQHRSHSTRQSQLPRQGRDSDGQWSMNESSGAELGLEEPRRGCRSTFMRCPCFPVYPHEVTYLLSSYLARDPLGPLAATCSPAGLPSTCQYPWFAWFLHAPCLIKDIEGAAAVLSLGSVPVCLTPCFHHALPRWAPSSSPCQVCERCLLAQCAWGHCRALASQGWNTRIFEFTSFIGKIQLSRQILHIPDLSVEERKMIQLSSWGHSPKRHF